MTSKQTHNVFCGLFNTESYYKDIQYANLPEIKMFSKDMIINLDDLFFPLIQSSDLLLTRKGFDKEFYNYLNQWGFNFECNFINIKNNNQINKNTFRLLIDERYDINILEQYLKWDTFKTFSFINDMDEFCKLYQLKCEYPLINVIKKVNSKLFSIDAREYLNIENYSEIVISFEDYMKKSQKFTNAFLLKDPYGVSGQGIIKIENNSERELIGKHLKHQEIKGKKICFIIEPLLPKKMDFSCQIYISKIGKVEIISINEMVNKGFGFAAITNPDLKLFSTIHKTNYIEIIQEIGKYLYLHGYFGYACIDSMILNDEKLIPIVEINARQSMSNIKNRLIEKLNILQEKTILLYLDFINSHLTFKVYLSLLQQYKILYNGKIGVFPLNANTFKNEGMQDDVKKSRVYVLIVYESEDQLIEYYKKVKYILNCEK